MSNPDDNKPKEWLEYAGWQIAEKVQLHAYKEHRSYSDITFIERAALTQAEAFLVEWKEREKLWIEMMDRQEERALKAEAEIARLSEQHRTGCGPLAERCDQQNEIIGVLEDALKEIGDGISPMGGHIPPDGHRRRIANEALAKLSEWRKK